MDMSFVSMNLVTMLYLIASVCFIQALKGLSHPTTARRGNYLGMVGMAIAILTTLAAHPPTDAIGWLLVVGGIVIGGGSGWARTFGFLGLILASVNIFGGFLVTYRMLAMYKKREAPAAKVKS